MDAKKNLYNSKKLENNLRNNNIFIDNLPTQVHFLMIDKCNAKCLMCGGNYFHSNSKRKITLDKFKKMASNLQLQLCRGIVLAGAGDPLLNRDLIPIIRFVREKYPHIAISITTNGIALTENLSKSFLDSDVRMVNISINSATRETYQKIMQVDCFDKVCKNVKNFVDMKNRLGKITRVQFSSAINRLNIEELPLLLELSRDLGVDSINNMYCRFYPEKIRHWNVAHEETRLHDKDSLFYHQELSDRVVEKTEALAKKYRIDFSHEPLFKENASPHPCIWPVMELMVGFDGEVYPCGGSEVHFKEKIEKGIYNFGNALSESIDSFWNNEFYQTLRISSKKGTTCLTAECRCCANALSPNDIRAHIMEWDKGIFGEKKQRDEDQKESEKKCSEDTSPLVSVIVPTYNRPDMLAEALKSILQQTFRKFEIVVVNDAGMSVEDVVSKLNKEKNIVYVSHAGNRGLAAARNTGIMVARGKYIALLDDDDLFYPNHLETAMVHVSEQTPVIYTDGVRATYEKYNDSYRLVGKKVPYSIDFERDKLLVGNISPVNCFVFEKDKGLQAGLFDETLTTLEDWDFWIRLSELCKFKHITKVTAQVNWRTDGTTMTSSLGADFKKNRDKIYNRYKEQINKIDDIEAILKEFKKIWKADSKPALPLVSIVILVCNQISYTKKCIESIIKNTKVPFELIVVDNGSMDGTDEYLESELTQLIPEDRLRVITNNENLGFAAGNNQGIAVARGKYILLMNNDIVVTPGWLTHLIACAEQDRKIGIVGPVSNYVSGPQLVKDVTYNTENLHGLNEFASEVSNRHSGKTTPFWRVVGFCMLIKRDVIDKIGGLDARYGLGNFEDDDFSLRATLAGYESRIAEDCFIHHFGNRTFIAVRIDYKKSLHKNWEIFKEKWGIPKNVPYGSSYDLSFLLKDGFIHSKHYFSIGETPDLQISKDKTIVSISNQEGKYPEIQQLIATGKKQEAKEALEKLLLDDPKCALAHNDLGILYFQAGDKTKASKHYERAVALQPVNVTFLKNLADFYYVELGSVEDAMKLYVKILYLNSKDKETLLIMGHICVSLKKLDDAKEFYYRVLEIDPLNADAQQVLDKLLETEPAVHPDIQVSIIIPTAGPQKYIRKCVESVNKYTPEAYEIIFVDNGAGKGLTKWLKQNMGESSNCSLIKCPKNASLAAIYNEGVKASTGQYVVLLSNDVVVSEKWLSGMLECMKRVPDAGIVGPMSNISRGLQKRSTTEKVSIDQLDNITESFMTKNRYRRISSNSVDGFCMLFARDLVEEIGLFDEQFGKNGYEDEDFCIRSGLEGRINLIAGDVYVYRQNKKAVVRNKRCFNEKWNKADSHSLSGKRYLTLTAIERGREAYQRGNMDDAVELFLEGIRLLPDDSRAYYALAEMLLQSKNYKDAIDILNEIPQDEGDVRRFELIGYCKEGIDLDQEALGHADHALSINGNSATALNLKGLLAYKQGEMGFAEDYFKKAMGADPGYGEPYTNLGAILWDNRPEDALDLFERGFVLSPMIPDIVTNYHSAITASGEFERAGRGFEEAGLLCPNNKMIKYMLIDVLTKQGKNKEAMHQIEDAIALFGVDEGILPAALKIRELLGPKEINKEMKQKGTVSLCMIVKNEEKYLAKCLRSVKPVVDEMIVVDTGSTDRTKDIAAVFGAKVYDFEWTGDFSEARNFSLSKASGKWTFHLDADEVISPLDYDDFRKVIRRSTAKDAAFLVNTRNYTMKGNLVEWVANDGKYNMEESGTGWTPSEKVRLFRNDRRIRFAYPVHELVDPYLTKAGIAPKRCTVQIHHYGKMNQEKSLDKGEVYYQIGRKKLDEMGEDAIALRELAIQAEILKKHDEAIELWEKFIAIDPNEPNAYINIGISYCSLGKFEDVLETAKKAMRLAPDMKEAHYHYALGKLHLGSAAEAVSILEKLLERVGKYPPAKFLLAAAYCCAKEKQKGIEILHELQKTSISQSLPVRCHELAKGLISSGKSEYALLLLDAGIDSKNGNKNVLELYAKCLEMTDDNDKSETNQTVLYKRIETTDNKCDTRNEIPDLDILKQAWELKQKGQTNNAIEKALKAIGQFPDDKRTYYFLVQMLIDAKQHKDAFDVLNEMPQDEHDVKRLELLGYCKEGMKQYYDAKNYADQMLSLNPSSAPALNLKGLLEYNQGNNSKAENFFRQAIESDQGYGEPYTNLGAIRWEKDRDEALGLFEKAFTLSPVISDVVANYHTAASTLGAVERAEAVFEGISSLYPKNKLIKYRLIDLLIKQEKHAQAMEQIEDAIALFGVDDGILSSALKIRDLLGPKEIDKSKDANNTVSLCTIVKNEEKQLAGCLKSVKPVVDEMIIVDTGSTDRTKDIAKAFGAKLYDFKWTDDFSEARNYSISKAEGKWIFALDADEVISTLDYKQFQNILKKSSAKPVAYQFTTRNYNFATNLIGWHANDKKYGKENAGQGWSGSDKVRLFPNQPGIRFEYPVHELVAPTLKRSGVEVKKCAIPVHHYGRLNKGESDHKGETYYQIGRKKLDEMENSEAALRELAVQAEVLGKHEESIELWERLITIHPEMPIAFVNMATAYMHLGEYEKAVASAGKALRIAPDLKEAHYNYAFGLVHLGRIKEAVIVLEKPINGLSEYPPAAFLLAMTYCLDKREDVWPGSFNKLRQSMGPGFPVACSEFAKGLVSAHRYDDAVILLEAAIKSKNSNKEMHALYSECLSKKKSLTGG